MELDPKYDHYDFPTKAPIEAPGHPGYLKPEEQAQVAQLRMMLEAEGFTKRLDTLTLLRFLRARKFDVNAAKQMFADCEKWRAETNLDDTVSTWEFPEKAQLFDYYPQYYHKTDKDGRPVYIEQLGKIDIAALNKISTPDRMLTNLAVEYERLADDRLPACSRKSGHLLETCCSIIDLKGVSLGKATSVYSQIQSTSALSQNYYPERLGHLFLINCPWGFSAIWSIIKGWLDPVTVKKIHILGSGYQNELLTHIPAENLPVEFGGTCNCEGGCHLSNMGPWREEQWANPPKKDAPAPAEPEAKEAAAPAEAEAKPEEAKAAA
ncbi:probable phosphatidylinositol/phosphatidylcholine transfer protein SEC14 [Cephalotrichum gorgonifer]|uniref:Probable phosphatidylinositol/phosphatidylcholine transfer protein SEC14 n=1 Tax=Cephalotrichum gorgonifer TaxID=2041049 RepID=A0AAE8N2U5_9PEZI|nr:probable phosphatidylinositol/phosphatidylcholine transfer protein SEC14 [Cephalotrichum gorgonifer]